MVFVKIEQLEQQRQRLREQRESATAEAAKLREEQAFSTQKIEQPELPDLQINKLEEQVAKSGLGYKLGGAREDGEANGGESHMAESVTAFWLDFNDKHQALCSAVDALKAEHAVGSAAVDTAAVNAQLDALVADAQQLQAITAAAAIFLPAYDVRRAGEEAANALAEVEAARGVLVPRKKFSFKAKAKR
ncbi:hypothetical protein JKP88DRAFT_287256 [Tribonema minus]|uniref:Tubulin-specific chaperone C N-terminal domain-containing protein n=1 Tax=Tribonema minus TaxID=303371 RepID=A0A836CKL6_9STRA|nr:hypothetical protein JKP88DRAFT_287256 [Tribonema minus]